MGRIFRGALVERPAHFPNGRTLVYRNKGDCILAESLEGRAVEQGTVVERESSDSRRATRGQRDGAFKAGEAAA